MSKTFNIEDVQFHENNLNQGSERGDELLEQSIERFGFREAGVLDKNGKIISGNHRTKKAAELGHDEVEIIKGDPQKITYIQYDDITLDSPRGKELALALNKTAKRNINIDIDLAVTELAPQVLEDWDVMVIEEPAGDELGREPNNAPPTMKITFDNPEQLQKAEIDIRELLDRKYPGSFFSVSAGGM